MSTKNASPKSSWLLKGAELTIDRAAPLGSLNAAHVFIGSWANRPVAVKLLSSSASIDVLAERIELWENLSHPHVLKLFGSPLDPEYPCLAMQYHSTGNARQYVIRNPDANRLEILQQTAQAMQYLHSRGVVHGSLKPSNILIQRDGSACVADVDLVKVQPSTSAHAHRYYSPEAWKGVTSQSSDVFAFAMTAYEIFSSEIPWGVLSEKQIYQHVVIDDTRPDRLDPQTEERVGLSDRIWGVIEESWHKEARLRPDFRIILGMWNINSPSFLSLQDDSPLDPHPPRIIAPTSPDISDDLPPPPSYEAAIIPPTPVDQPQHVYAPSPPKDPSWLRNDRRSIPSSSEASSSSQSSYSRPPSAASSASASTNRPPSASSSGSASTNRLSSPKALTPLKRFPMPPLHDEVPSSRSWEPGASRNPRQPNSNDERPLPPPPKSAPYSQSTFENMQMTNGPLQPQRSIRQVSRWDSQSLISDSSSAFGAPNAVLLVQSLQMEVRSYRKDELIDGLLIRIQHLAFNSDKNTQKLVTAGAIPTLIDVLKIRAVTGEGLIPVLTTLGLLAHDSISANTIFRTQTTSTLIQIMDSADTPELTALSAWCLNRVSRTAEIAAGLIKQGVVRLLQRTVRSDYPLVAQHAAWAIGSLVHSDTGADELAIMGIIPELVHYLHLRSSSSEALPEEVCAGAFALARVSRSIKLAKQISKAGALPLLAHHMNESTDPNVLHWICRAVGCLMRPNSGDMAKALLDAGTAKGLARVPSVLPTEDVEPLGSFAFAIQRFSCAEWGAGTRKTLLEAGAVDALLAALRTASTEPYPGVHIELALAVSFLGDVGGGSLRREIVNAGGIDILRSVASTAAPDVAKACNMAITSITGNIWTRNAASAKTAMSHNWSGGCPDYQPPCPVALGDLDEP